MQRDIVIMGIILSSIAVFMIFIGVTVEYIIGALGVILIFISIPMAIIGLVLKGNELSSTRRCPKCNSKNIHERRTKTKPKYKCGACGHEFPNP
jgi:rubredoxin